MMKYLQCFILLVCCQPLSAAVNVDYAHLDTLGKCTQKVYHAGVRPNWLGKSYYFWYKNYERTGTFFYLVNAQTGDKFQADEKEELVRFLPENKTELIDLLIGEKNKSSQQMNQRTNARIEGIVSPDGKWTAIIRDNNIFVRSLNQKEKEEFFLSNDGTTNWDYTNIQWSPDSRKIAALKIRRTPIRKIPLLESAPSTQKQPILQWRNYAKPGDALPVSTPALFDVEKKVQIKLDTQLYEHQFNLYLTGWRADSRAFTFEFNQRGHQRYIVAEVNAGNGKITHLADEKTNTFIEYNKNYRYDLNDGEEMIWMSERDGWRHLYLMDNSGNVKNQITKGKWVVRSVKEVNEENRIIYFMASGIHPKEDPYNLHYCCIRMDGSGFKDLTPENGNHVLSFSSDNKYFVDVYSRPDQPQISLIRSVDHPSEVKELQRCDIKDWQAEGWQVPEVFHAKGRDGKTDIWGTIWRPRNYDPKKSYPIVENMYAGPHDSFVNKNFSAFDFFITPFTELGFIVVKIDGMGTNNRSKAFHDVCWKNLKDAGFPDRILWIKSAAKKYAYMDTARVGIYGWSAGGQSALGALLFFNDFYSTAVSFCGCHDNRMDKIWWNEQWMGYPVDDSYRQSSNVDNAHLMKGNLLIINGELDDNVDPASTLQVVDALVKANKYFEQLYLPGHTHNLGGWYEVHRMYEFFVRNMKPSSAYSGHTK